MKAKIKETGEIVDVLPCGSQTSLWSNTKRNELYNKWELEFEPFAPEKTVIEGWVAVDEWGIGGCFLHTQKPHAENREFCDTGEYEIEWKSEGDKFELDSKLFPDMDCES